MNIYRFVLVLPSAIVITTAVALVSAVLQRPERSTALITAVEYFDAGMYKRAQPLFRKVAEKGNGEAANFLGVMFESGQGDLPCDPTQAAAWYRRAADLGNREGMLNLGKMYHAGTGVPRDEWQAVRWYCKAAARGSGPSMTAMGIVYLMRSGVQNELAAAKWFQRGADAGDPFGMFAIATMYKTRPRNLPEDDLKATYWNNRANQALKLLSAAPMHTLVRRGYCCGMPWHRKAPLPMIQGYEEENEKWKWMDDRYAIAIVVDEEITTIRTTLPGKPVKGGSFVSHGSRVEPIRAWPRSYRLSVRTTQHMQAYGEWMKAKTHRDLLRFLCRTELV
jgi:hypothetical protein